MMRRPDGQPVTHHRRPTPPCSVQGCKRTGHYRGLCARHVDEAAQHDFTVLDSYLPGGSRHTP